jgi:hypothetical protein
MNKNVFVRQLEKRHVFWSYSPGAVLPDEVIIEHVLKFGDISDIIELFELFPKDEIEKVWYKTMAPDNRFDKTNHYLKLFFFKNISKPIETRYDRIKRACSEN